MRFFECLVGVVSGGRYVVGLDAGFSLGNVRGWECGELAESVVV